MFSRSYFPSRKLIVETDFSQEELLERMSRFVRPFTLRKFIPFDKCLFSGDIDGDHFKLYREDSYSRGTIEIAGSLMKTDHGARLHVTFQTPFFVNMLAGAFAISGLLVLVASFVLPLTVRLTIILIGAGMVLVPYILLQLSFLFGFSHALDGLHRMTSGRVHGE